MADFSPLIRLPFVSHGSETTLWTGLSDWQALGLFDDDGSYLELEIQQSASPRLRLTLASQDQIAETLTGLEYWHQLGLLNTAKIDGLVVVHAQNPQLLEGLAQWQILGILQASQIRRLCSLYLSCELPMAEVPRRPVEPTPKILRPSLKTERGPQPVTIPRPPSRLQQVTQALMEELSVFWLLLLGVLMVVVSSGVLAASQWQRFPPIGQYSILLLYTLAFGLASFWCGRQANLRLTTQALRLISLLLVPINFIAMDSIPLWHSLGGWLGAGLAVVLLAGLSFSLLPPSRGSRPWAALNHLGLSAVHWGWGLAGWPLLAANLGVSSTALLTLYRYHQGERFQARTYAPFGLNGGLLIYGLFILLIRAIFIAGVPVAQLGAALALCGALWVWQGQRAEGPTESGKTTKFPLHHGGEALIFLGWFVSVMSEPSQALVASVLGLWCLGQRLGRRESAGDLMLIWLIGLQMHWLAWRLLPTIIQNSLISLGMTLAGLETNAWPLLSLVFFPYLVVTTVLWRWFRQRQRWILARTCLGLAVALGLVLLVLSLPSPLVRSVYLLGTTLILAVCTHAEAHLFPSAEIAVTKTLAHWAHGVGLATLLAWLDWIWPDLNFAQGFGILFVLTTAETYLSLVPPPRQPLAILLWPTRYGFNLALAALAYSLLIFNQMLGEAGLTSWRGHGVVSPLWNGLAGLIPLLFTSTLWLRRRDRETTAQLSITWAILWQALTLSVPPLRLGAWAMATVILAVNTTYWPRLAATLLTVGFGLGTAVGVFETYGPPLSLSGWLLLGSLALWLLWGMRQVLAPSPSRLNFLYSQACDIWGWGLYGLLLSPAWVWSPVLTRQDPLVITLALSLLMGAVFYRSWQRPRSANLAWISIGLLPFTVLPLGPLGGGRVWGVGIATIVLVCQTQFLRKRLSAALTVGSALLFLALSFWELLPQWTPNRFGEWLLLGAITLMALWLARRALLLRRNALASLYRWALDRWGVALCGLELIGLTLHGLLVYNDLVPPSLPATLGAAITLGAIGLRTWPRLNNRSLYSLGLALELLAIQGLALTSQSLLALTLVNLALGLLTQLLGDWWHRRSGQEQYLSSLHSLPLLYGALGASLRWGLFERWTGLTTLCLVFIAMGVGRRREEFKPLLYLALVGISLSAYELLQYQLVGLPWGDQLLAMAALATTILYGYRLLAPWLTDYLGLAPAEFQQMAHLHWGLGSLLLGLAVFYPVEIHQLVGIGAGIFLTRYALWQGRFHPNLEIGEIWVYAGLLEGVAITSYAFYQSPLPLRLDGYLHPYLGLIMAWLGLVLYRSPWRAWGWSPRPWQSVALVLPFVGLIPNRTGFYPLNFWAGAGFYSILAVWQRNIRWSYLSLFLGTAGLFSMLNHWFWQEPLAYALILALDVFYVAALDPELQGEEGRELRHWLRFLGTMLIGTTSLVFNIQPLGLIPGALGLVLIFAGLGLKIRAFLYGGTLTFLGAIFYQFVVLILEAPVIKWIVGLLLGLSFIWVAATFETRREQFSLWVRNWLTDFETWD
ncbi:hypothetical protein [Synechocystis sp. LKSZ1]|uniref:hypothetical protein n=1 Tax=Synechocystis sp. LKSZ1 TaxID=3144951 RepID=UPI00336C06D9